MNHKIEKLIEHGLFASRWIMAPFYIGLVVALCILLYSFAQELFHLLHNISQINENTAILGTLSLIDLSLGGNLLLIVIFAGYENFVSKMDIGEHKDNPEWKRSVDFSTLKLKLVSSMVAISGIHLLRTFMDIENVSKERIVLMLAIHLTFVTSGVLLALMDYISAKAKMKKHQ